MKNRILNQAMKLVVSAVLFTMAVCGKWGQTVEIKASDVDNGGLRVQQSAQWTGEGTYQAEIVMEVGGLLAYREQYEQKYQEEVPGASDETENYPPEDTVFGVTEEGVEDDDWDITEEEAAAAEETWDEDGENWEEPDIWEEQAEEAGDWYEEEWLGEELSEISEEPEVDLEAAYAGEESFGEEYEAEGEKLPQLYVENYISEFFRPVRETLPENSWVEECSVINRNGQETVLGKVVYPINIRNVYEDVLRLSFLVELREEYRYPAAAAQYPVSQDEPLNKDCEGTGGHILEVQGLESTIMAQAYAPVLEVQEAEADFSLKLKARTPEVKAGGACVYELLVENTGDMELKKIQIRSDFAIEETGSEEVKAVWESAQTVEVQGKQALIPVLGRGERVSLFLTAQLEEGDSGKMLHKVSAQAPCPKVEGEVIGKEVLAEVQILPLKADFTVEKTADRSQAYPGDTINYQICIRNTGERTLHSVLSTERFLGASMQAQFLPKEGVTLNAARTQALIKEIAPGEAFALQAAVILPQYMASQELVNQVLVISEETGTRSYESQAKVKVGNASVTPTPYIYSGYQTNYSGGNMGKSAYPVTSLPKTGDDTKIGVFVMLLSLAVLSTAGVIWKRKGKSKD